MAGAPHVAVPTVRILTDSALHFIRAFAGGYKNGTLLLRNPSPLGVGRKLRVEIVTRAGEVLLSGDAEVAASLDATNGGPANRLRFTALEKGEELLERLAMPPGLRPATTPQKTRASAPAPEAPATTEWTVPGRKPQTVVERLPVDTPEERPAEEPRTKAFEGPPADPEDRTRRHVAPDGGEAQPEPESEPEPEPEAPPDTAPPPAAGLVVGAAGDVERDMERWADRPASFRFPEIRGPKSSRVIGIDLGTAFTCAGYVDEKGKPRVIPGEHGRRSFPSSVWIDGSRYLVGEPAMDWIERDPKNVIHSWKRLLGRDYESDAVQDALAHVSYDVESGPAGEAAIRIERLLCHPSWFAARVLYEIRERALVHLSEVVESAVITVPAHYGDLQRADVRHAAQLAGFTNVRLITEPVAAAIAYGVTHQARESTLLTYDFGGGTFDASVVELDGRAFQVIATGGDPFLGGVDFDDRIMGHLLLEFFRKEGLNLSSDFPAMVRVAGAAERAKRELSERAEARVAIPFVAVRDGKGIALDVTLSRAKLEELCGDLVQRTLNACEVTLGQAGLAPADLDEVVLVGGMTRVPLVSRRVEEHFLRAPRRGINADEAVALGAAAFGDSLGREDGLAILDVVALAAGVRGPDGASFVPVIPAGVQLPTTKTHVVRAEQDGQTWFRLDVYQGNSTLASLCEYLGSAEVTGLPPASKGETVAEVQFRMTEDGTLALATQDRSRSGFRRLGLRYQAAKARARKPSAAREDVRGVAYLRKLLGGR